MDDNQDIKICSEHQTCLYRLDCVEKWKEGVEKKLDGFTKLLIANLTGVVLTLLGIVGGLLIYIAR